MLILTPFQGGSHGGDTYPGLKPQAKSSSPFGANVIRLFAIESCFYWDNAPLQGAQGLTQAILTPFQGGSHGDGTRG
jgi:hypothetical protein